MACPPHKAKKILDTTLKLAQTCAKHGTQLRVCARCGQRFCPKCNRTRRQ